MEDHSLLEPLLSSSSTTTTTTDIAAAASTIQDDDEAEFMNLISSNSSISLRLLLIFLIGIVSIWADYEASKGFGITIINDAKDSPAGKRFALLYISNDKATRIVQNASSFVENFLYPNLSHTKKQVRHVTLKLIPTNNLPNMVTVNPNAKNDEFVIKISPSSIFMEAAINYKNLDSAVISMIVQGMARVWLWNFESSKPPSWLLDGMVEYINGLAGFSPLRNFGGGYELPEFGHFCFGNNKEPRAVAQFLGYGQIHNEGFIQRLNQAFKDGWHNRTVEDTLGTSVHNLCDSYSKNSSHNFTSYSW